MENLSGAEDADGAAVAENRHGGGGHA
jgi:hypothetical protein